MPIYTFKNKENGEILEYTMRVAELDDFKKNNPNLERYFSPETCNVDFTFVEGGSRLKSMNGGMSRVDPKFEEQVIDRCKRNIPGNKLSETHKSSQNRV